MAEQRLTIIVNTKSKRRAVEIVKFLSALVQLGETIQYSIEDAEPGKGVESAKTKRAIKR